ncbi:lysoplasmalogenase family protein [Qipengyuania nanhaisediminis]|uniref:lysoplasmalogenase family protein n=1 Tax=Qipengyuania nanhaisediminis TaxID=604088 RepID=UPI0038B40533
MPKRALIEHRPWLLASITAAILYYFLWNNPIGGVWLIALKGSTAALLAAYAWRRTRGTDAMLLVAVLAISALADMAIELSFAVGGALFAAAHLVAIALYLRNRRERSVWSQRLTALAFLVLAPAIAWGLSGRADIALYGLVLGAMVGAAWISRFPRYRVGLGAVLFLASDWLIFGRLGPFDLAPIADVLVWPLYYAGQLMIATGVVQTLRGERPRR